MSDHSFILPQSPTIAPAAIKDVMPAREQLQNELEIQPLQKTSIQLKLSIGSSDNPLEQEADAMADTIMRMPEQNFIQRKCSHCEEEEKVQRKPLASFIQRKESSSDAVASDAISSQINSSRGSGSNMDNQTQSFMQSRFGTDFSDVKIHTGNESSQLNRELGAKAFTVGNDIYFNEGQYNPGSGGGKHLLAHELTHTIQQGAVLQNKTLRRQIKTIPVTAFNINTPSIQRAMKFELQTGNIIWRTDGTKRKELPRKFGPHDFLHKGTKGKPATGTKEGAAVELQSEHGGFVEFETPKWFSKWCDLKERIQEAVDMVDTINKSKVISTIGVVNTVKYPFDTKRLLKTDKFPQGLSSKESLIVEILDPTWEAKIQVSEAIELSQYESLSKEHELASKVTSNLTSAQNILNTANTASLPATSLVNLLGFLQMISNYIMRGQAVDLSNPGAKEGTIAKAAFMLMSRTSFSSIYRSSLLSKDEKILFQQMIKIDLILKEFGLDRKSMFFKHGQGTRRLPGPTVFDWLTSIMGSGKDVLSPPKAGSEAMGRFDVVTTSGEKDTNLVKFEARGSVTHGNTKGEMLSPAKDWVSFAETIFKEAFTKRNRTDSTELKYNPSKCP